jgi:hypothetical protein
MKEKAHRSLKVIKQSVRKLRKKTKRAYAQRYSGPSPISVLLTRGVEIFAVLTSLLWAVEATAVENRTLSSQPSRSLSSLALPKDLGPNSEFLRNTKPASRVEQNESQYPYRLQSSLHLDPAIQLRQLDPTIQIRQNPYFAEPAVELARFPTWTR